MSETVINTLIHFDPEANPRVRLTESVARVVEYGDGSVKVESRELVNFPAGLTGAKLGPNREPARGPNYVLHRPGSFAAGTSTKTGEPFRINLAEASLEAAYRQGVPVVPAD